MCGACGAGSARSAAHWSAPFLASVPARSAAARTLTRWARATGWSGTVSGVAGGFQVAGASGWRSLAVDLPAAVEQLEAYEVRGDRLLDASSDGVVDGPPTLPGPRAHATTVLPGEAAADPVGGATRWVLPIDPRRHYRIPGLLTWLVVAERSRTLGRVTVHLRLDGSAGMLFASDQGGAATCEVVPAPALDVVLGSEQGAGGGLIALLGPAVPSLVLAPTA